MQHMHMLKAGGALTPALYLLSYLGVGNPGSSILQAILLLPLMGAVCLIFLPSSAQDTHKSIALLTSLITFVLSLFLWVLFDHHTPEFQFVTEFHTLMTTSGTPISFGVDGVSLLLILLTCVLVSICLLLGWDQGAMGESVSRDTKVSGLQTRGTGSGVTTLNNLKAYYVSLLVLQTLLIAVFTVLDLLLFYIFFEGVLVPMYFIIGIWGSRERKITAAYMFFLYTLFGSLFMLLAILMVYFQTGSTDIHTLYLSEISKSRQLILWLAFFFSFAIKVPMIPLHLWLPEAHVEAPTSGSVMLAGILLKLGAYGFLRYSIPVLPYASSYFAPMVWVLSVLAILYASLSCLRQIDLKKIVAYSSVAHMGFVTLGLFGNAPEGALFLMLSHGVVSSALFVCVGQLYERHKTRLLTYYGGIVQVMPVFSSIFFLFTLGNLSMPCTSNFVGEFMVLLHTYNTNKVCGTLAATGMVLGAGYSIWMYNRVVFGTRPKVEFISHFADLDRREFCSLLPLIFLLFWMGIYPQAFINVFHASVAHLCMPS